MNITSTLRNGYENSYTDHYFAKFSGYGRSGHILIFSSNRTSRLIWSSVCDFGSPTCFRYLSSSLLETCIVSYLNNLQIHRFESFVVAAIICKTVQISYSFLRRCIALQFSIKASRTMDANWPDLGLTHNCLVSNQQLHLLLPGFHIFVVPRAQWTHCESWGCWRWWGKGRTELAGKNSCKSQGKIPLPSAV